jgi:hypothetical protein
MKGSNSRCKNLAYKFEINTWFACHEQPTATHRLLEWISYIETTHRYMSVHMLGSNDGCYVWFVALQISAGVSDSTGRSLGASAGAGEECRHCCSNRHGATAAATGMSLLLQQQACCCCCSNGHVATAVATGMLGADCALSMHMQHGLDGQRLLEMY